MSKEKILNTETLVAAIKEVAEVIAKNGGAEIKGRVIENSDVETLIHIIIEPHRYIKREDDKK